MKEKIRELLPESIEILLSKIKKIFVYKDYDSTAYWKTRAKEPRQAAVLWQNQEYNELYREIQTKIISSCIKDLKKGSKLLDIGCGIGVVSKMINDINDGVLIDAVDFSEMIKVAKLTINKPNINFIESSAEEYLHQPNTYDVVLSSGCYSAIRDINKLEKSIKNGALMLKPDGRMIMIDPFHQWSYLARAKYGTNDVVNLLRKNNLILEKKTGVLFWPFREWLANSSYIGEGLASKFRFGEKLLSLFGKHFWADYKVLVFKKVP